MNEENDIEYRINLSIIYSISKWHLLLTACVHPFIVKMEQTGYLSSYYIGLSQQPSSNIRLSILSDKQNGEMLINTTDTYFKEFLTAFPCLPPTATPSISLFEGYKENNIYYNLYKEHPLPVSKEIRDIVYRQKQYFSSLIIMLIKENDADDDSRLAFLIYSMMAAITIPIPISSNSNNHFRAILDYWSANKLFRGVPIGNDEHSWENKFHQQLPILLKVREDVSNDHHITSVLQWIDGWKKQCRQTFHELELILSQRFTNSTELIRRRIEIHSFLFENMAAQLGFSITVSWGALYLSGKTISYH